MATNPDSVHNGDSGPSIGRRGAARARLQANASLATSTGETAIIIRNLSRTGAMVEGTKLPIEGRTALLRRGNIDAFGIVVWRNGHRCGILFDEELPHEIVVAEARKPIEAPARPAPSRWSPAVIDEVTTMEDWQKAQARAKREYGMIRSFS